MCDGVEDALAAVLAQKTVVGVAVRHAAMLQPGHASGRRSGCGDGRRRTAVAMAAHNRRAADVERIRNSSPQHGSSPP